MTPGRPACTLAYRRGSAPMSHARHAEILDSRFDRARSCRRACRCGCRGGFSIDADFRDGGHGHARMEASARSDRLPVPAKRRRRGTHVRPLDHPGNVLEGVEICRADSRPRQCGAAARERERLSSSRDPGVRRRRSAQPSRVHRRPTTPVRASPRLADIQDGHLRLEAPARCRRLSVLTRRCRGVRHLRSIHDDCDVLERRTVRGGCSPSADSTDVWTTPSEPLREHPPRRSTRNVRVQDSPTRGVQAPGGGADADDGHLPLEASAGDRRVPIRSERQVGVPDLRPLDDDGDVLEGITVRSRCRTDDNAQEADDDDARAGLRARNHRLTEGG